MTYLNVYSGYILFFLVVFANSSEDNPDKPIPKTVIPDGWDDDILREFWPYVQFHPSHYMQSPVDIATENATCRDYKCVKHYGYWGEESLWVNITNIGHTLEAELTEAEKEYFLFGISGGPLLDDFYEFDNMHFHWGSGDHGSEHTIDGRSYAMEIHIVHFNSKYGTAENAMNFIDGYAVASYFGELSDEDDEEMENLIDDLQYVIEPGQSILRQIGVEFKFLEKIATLQDYYAYPGSLTTGTFAECVIWMAFVNTFKISERQLAAFRQLHSSENHALINHNDRELQQFNNRPITTSFCKNNCEN